MKKIKTGKVELSSEEFNPKKGKFRMNMFVDLDVIDQIRKLAADEHMPYQTWVNRKLREVVLGRIEKRVNRKVLNRA